MMKTAWTNHKNLSDEKLFTTAILLSEGDPSDVKGIFKSKHQTQVMVLGVVASYGKKMPPFFFRSVEKVGAEVYYKVQCYKVLPWLKVNYPNGNYVWTQDVTLPHTAKKVQKFCKDNSEDFCPATFCPSSSPDLKGYCIIKFTIRNNPVWRLYP